MNHLEFSLSSEYIELIKLLKLLNLVESGADAKIVVEEGLVKYNDEIEFRKRKKLRSGDVVEFNNSTIKIS
ncbi:RNA-binding S4 domain-containing protein [Vicingaceae bacterium]|jgi:ribosome-associated protein|nr:RNA-binding S4 domain-containing protein [Vicingaceae bacterium]